jgi:drug/metabolite transporter (DMT)-like permease
VLAFFAVYVIWGSTYLAIRIGIETIPPFLMAGSRFLVAGVPLVVLALARGAPRPVASEWRAAALVGVLMLVGGNGLVTWAEQTVLSSVAAVLIALVPLWMALFDRVLFRGPPLGPLTLTGIALGFAGVVVLMSGSGADGAPGTFAGRIAVVVASMLWALGSLASRRSVLPRSPMLSVGMQMTVAGAVMLAIAGVRGEWARVDPSAVSARSLLALGYLALFGSIVALSAYLWLLRTTTAAAVSTYAFVNPVVAVVLGWLLGGEHLDGRALVAASLIVSAVLCLYRVRARPRRRDRAVVDGLPAASLTNVAPTSRS